MEEDPGASESDASARSLWNRCESVLRAARPVCASLGLFLLFFTDGVRAAEDSLNRVRAAGLLVYGSDMEGGGPYAFPNPQSPSDVTGFEVELMAEVAAELGVRPRFSQGQWDKLLQVLDSGRIDVVANGYEWSETRARGYLATRPYYVYKLQLLVQKRAVISSWEELKKQPKAPGVPWRVGVLVGSAADEFVVNEGGPNIQVVRFDGATDAMTAVQNGQYDATLQDLPAALFYRERFSGLRFAGEAVGRGYYVLYTREGDRTLRDALDQALGRLIASGSLARVLRKYGIWTEAQAELASFAGPLEPKGAAEDPRGLALVARYARPLLHAALVTIALSIASMPLAMLTGLLIAIAGMYGPRPARLLARGYVELIRGTPLMLQLFVLFFLLKLPPWVAGIAGLAINYSAYEAEIYRAGLQAVPPGQMEAALALGMSRLMALRRVIVPQAVRIVIPPVASDFIALFKDTSVCSVITLVDLTKEYSILANSTRGGIEFAVTVSILYLAMSVPLSWFARWSESRFGAARKGVVA